LSDNADVDEPQPVTGLPAAWCICVICRRSGDICRWICFLE